MDNIFIIGNYLDNAIHLLLTILVSDCFFKAFEGIYEYINYKRRYLPEQRISLIFKRAFSYNMPSVVLIVGVAFAALLRFGISQRSPLPPNAYFLYMPLYWIARLVQLDFNHIKYIKWIRHRHGLDYGEGMASSYFHGYLNLTMPSYGGEGCEGVGERITLYSDKHGVTFAINRLVILIPSTMYIAPIIESELLERSVPLTTLLKNRAGNMRPYKNDVYRFKKPINGTFYYVALEGATPLLTFSEAIRNEATSTWQMREMQREIMFKFYFSLKRILRAFPETEKEIELVFYNTHKTDGSHQDVGEVLIAHFENLWAKERHQKQL